MPNLRYSGTVRCNCPGKKTIVRKVRAKKSAKPKLPKGVKTKPLPKHKPKTRPLGKKKAAKTPGCKCKFTPAKATGGGCPPGGCT